MPKTHSTPSAPPSKPAKPDGCPLFPHSGRWAKKIRGRLVYFGKWDDLPAALKTYEAEKAEWFAGRNPREPQEHDAAPTIFTVGKLCNAFLKSRFILKQGGELSPRTYADYEGTTDIIVDHFDKWSAVAKLQPAQFLSLRAKLKERYGVHRLTNTVQRIRTIFKWAFDNGHIETPVRFGSDFKRPAQKLVRRERNTGGEKVITAEEIRRLLDASGPQLKAMILLGINAGYGNTDCGLLPIAAIDLDRAMVTFPRPKTEIPRRAPLWPETVTALREVLATRPTPKNPDHAGLVFITKYGQPWARDTESPVSKEFAKVLKELHINGRRRLNFYALRHTHRTVADEVKDTTAADYLMGHRDQHIRNAYIEGINDDRLKAVTDHVHDWLFPPKAAPKRRKKGGAS